MSHFVNEIYCIAKNFSLYNVNLSITFELIPFSNICLILFHTIMYRLFAHVLVRILLRYQKYKFNQQNWSLFLLNKY